jgi:hypothetical protein
MKLHSPKARIGLALIDAALNAGGSPAERLPVLFR